MRRFRFSDDGITDEIITSRCVSSYFIPIPYTIDGEEHQYLPDFFVRLDDGLAPGDLLNLIVEVTGEKRKDKATKIATARATGGNMACSSISSATPGYYPSTVISTFPVSSPPFLPGSSPPPSAKPPNCVPMVPKIRIVAKYYDHRNPVTW